MHDAVCSRCGHRPPPIARFCPRCGLEVSAGPAPHVMPPRPAGHRVLNFVTLLGILALLAMTMGIGPRGQVPVVAVILLGVQTLRLGAVRKAAAILLLCAAGFAALLGLVWLLSAVPHTSRAPRPVELGLPRSLQPQPAEPPSYSYPPQPVPQVIITTPSPRVQQTPYGPVITGLGADPGYYPGTSVGGVGSYPGVTMPGLQGQRVDPYTGMPINPGRASPYGPNVNPPGVGPTGLGNTGYPISRQPVGAVPRPGR